MEIYECCENALGSSKKKKKNLQSKTALKLTKGNM